MNTVKGFTLFSLIITIALTTLLSCIAIPSMAQFLSKQESLAAISMIHRNLSNARAMAINQKTVITVCGINIEQECTISGFKDIAMFEDRNRNAIIDFDETTYQISPLKYRDTLTLRASLGRSYIRFKTTGTAAQAGSFIYCSDSHKASFRRVTVSMTGRAYQNQNAYKNNTCG